jgi:hypothetical protein
MLSCAVLRLLWSYSYTCVASCSQSSRAFPSGQSSTHCTLWCPSTVRRCRCLGLVAPDASSSALAQHAVARTDEYEHGRDAAGASIRNVR